MRFTLRWLAVAATITAAAIAAAGCGSDDNSNTTAAGGAGGAGTKDVPAKTIGIVDVLSASEAAYRGEVAAKDAVKHVGWKYKFIDAQGDPQKSASAITSLVNQRVDAIISIANQPSTIQDGLRQAKDAGIPVINVAGTVPGSALLAGNYYPDDVALTKALDKFFFEKVGSGQIGSITAPIFFSLKIRDDQFKKDLAASSAKQVATHETDVSKAIEDTRSTVTDYLTAHPNMKGIWTDLDTDIPPAAEVLKSKNLCGKVTLVGFYGDKANLQALRDGCATAVVETAIEAPSYMAVDALLGKFVDDKPIPKQASATYQTFMDPMIVTKENVPADKKAYVAPAKDYVAFFQDKWAKEYGIK